jgi:hypothetical protein
MDLRDQYKDLEKTLKASLGTFSSQIGPLHKTLDELKSKFNFKRTAALHLGRYKGKIHITNENSITIELDDREQADSFLNEIHLYQRRPTSLFDACIRYFKKDI